MSLLDVLRHAWHRAQDNGRGLLFDLVELPLAFPGRRKRLDEQVAEGRIPRIAFVKQDVQDDLYCCPSGSSPKDIVCSTIMRTGPVALFTRSGADFHLVQTETDPECNIWQQRWTERQWTPIEHNLALRDNVPGRDCGQGDYSVPAGDIDWVQYDVVISIDVSVPARITQEYPSVAWCYYVREPHTSAYEDSIRKPLPGQDIFLNQRFRRTQQPKPAVHEIEFPYYLQYWGCFHELLSLPRDGEDRRGTFLEHHTPEHLTRSQVARLQTLGPVMSTANPSDETESGFGGAYEKTLMSPEEILLGLSRSKYFVKCGGRSVWGNAMVEAIAAGCLAIGDPRMHAHGFLFSKHSAAATFDEVIEKIKAFEESPALCRGELRRQRRLVDYLCYVRPTIDLFRKTMDVVASRATKPPGRGT